MPAKVDMIAKYSIFLSVDKYHLTKRSALICPVEINSIKKLPGIISVIITMTPTTVPRIEPTKANKNA
ncbi:MAG: hypothetical protein KA716_32555 [Gloeotrichia echinulata DEX184]